ncbi:MULTISPECIES: hypothetical protein [Pseudomonas]|uniref:hypothetical protein n=1 Tax=Pseudomonas TaxID=286 RepID=UPI000CD4CFC3|nr:MULTISPECIES: hypothetical protein [Pseudomonas]RBH59146.1 hypothetical protein C3F00_005105 [Pseudomonas sp. MWU13-2860]
MITDTQNDTKKLGALLAMRPSLSTLVKSQKIAFFLALFGIVALFGAKRLIEWALKEPVAESWVDLTLVLAAYLYFFMIPTLQAHISKKLRRRAARLRCQASNQATPPPSAGASVMVTPQGGEAQAKEGRTQPVDAEPRPTRQGQTLNR